MDTKANNLPPLIFPFYIGPTTRHFTTGLMFAGQLAVSMPGFMMRDPIEAFCQVRDRAVELEHPLLPLFLLVDHHFDLVQTQALDEIENLEPLGDHLLRAITVYDGTEEQYANWEAIHDPCLRIAANSLTDPQVINTATIDFIFRIFESALEIGEKPDEIGDDPDFILNRLLDRAVYLGGPELLLAECALNRYAMSRPGALRFVTNSQPALDILSYVGKPLQEGVETSKLRVEQLAFFLFDKLASPFSPNLVPPHVEHIAKLMDEKAEELDEMRKKCRLEADKLVGSDPEDSKLQIAVNDTLESMREEVSSVAKLDKASFKKLVSTLLEDKTAWTTIAGLIGSAFVPVPAAVSASLAVTAFSIMGASAVKASRERREALKASPWAFVYYLK